MAYDISGLVARIRQFEPSAKIVFAEEFSSQHQDHRAQIRASIAQTLGAGPEIYDLKSRPRLKDWSISVSHCQRLGGWIAVPRPLRAGLDIEIKARLTTQVIDRIAQPGELNGIPDPLYLWCAKEAYYKALEQEQPDAVTQIRVESWTADELGGWRFTSGGMRGSMLSAVDLLVSVAVI